MHSVTVIFEFEAAHRLMHHAGKCINLHGHSYQAVVTLKRKEIWPNGMLIDFGIVKDEIGKWINHSWDHATILHVDDDKLIEPLRDLDLKLYCMDEHPTAENMAAHLHAIAVERLEEMFEVEVESVTIMETRRCGATFRTGE